MTPGAIGVQNRRNPEERRSGERHALGLLHHLEPACLVKRRCFLSRVVNRRRLPAQFHACLEPVLLVRPLADRDEDLAGLPVARPIDAKHIPW